MQKKHLFNPKSLKHLFNSLLTPCPDEPVDIQGERVRPSGIDLPDILEVRRRGIHVSFEDLRERSLVLVVADAELVRTIVTATPHCVRAR